MTAPTLTYPYASRSREAGVLLLDYNEYTGRIHPDLAGGFEAERLARHYALSSADAVVARLRDATPWIGVTPAWATHGADEAIFHTLLAARLRGCPTWASAFAPSYEHALTFALQLGFAVAPSARAASLLYVCTPNNPTGEVWSESDVLLDDPATTWMVVDLTYEDYMTAEARRRQAAWVRARLASAHSTVVIKSYAKSLPIAGFRFGIVASNVPEVAAHFERVYNRKLITEAALHVMRHALDRDAFYAAEQRSIFEARGELQRGIADLAGAHGVRLSTPPGGNFIVGHGAEPTLQALHAALAEAGITARLKASPEGGTLLRLTSVPEAQLHDLLRRVGSSGQPTLSGSSATR